MKKILSLILVVALILPMAFSTAKAVEPIEPYASAYLSFYTASISTSEDSGKIILSFYVSSGRLGMTKVGVTGIEVYRTDGTRVKTIMGTVGNGLVGENCVSYGRDYTISLAAGTYYYCIVTVMAGNDTGSDSRRVTTNTVMAGL